jgi:periplasmic protein TonB
MPRATATPMTRLQVRRLGPCVAITIAAHAFLLAIPLRPAATSGTSSATHSSLAVRFIDPVPSDSRLDVPPVPPSAVVERLVAIGSLHEPRTALDPVEPLEPHTPTLSSAVNAFEAPTLLGLSLTGIPDEDDQFVVRSLLSLPPAPLSPVVIPYPDVDASAGRYVGQLTLFIDEHGTVVRVHPEGDALPPEFEQVARNAFLSVRFRPGEMQEHGPVKSRIRVEVVFEGGARRS